MNNYQLGVNLEDYANGGGGFGDGQAFYDQANTSQEELAELSKALEAGDITGRDTTDSTTASGAPLKVESLENTLKIITFKESDIQFWKRVPKLPAYNTVEEFNQLQSYGSEGGGFNNEGELPQEEDTTYVRRAELVKFLGVTKSVSHPMQLVRTHVGSAIQQEVRSGTLYILRKADRGLAFADSKIVPQEYNGFYAQHRKAFTTLDNYHDSENVIDMRGKNLSEGAIENGALAIIQNFGQGDLLMAPPVVLSDFVKDFHESKLIQPNSAQVTNGVMGQRVEKFQSQYGQIDLGYDIFLNAAPPRATGSGAQSTKAPAAPTTSGAATAADASSEMEAGDYQYAVAAINRYGESDVVAIGSAITVAAGQAVDLTFSDGGGSNPATGYTIYRTKVDDPTGKLYPIFKISTTELGDGYDGAAAGSVRDKNRWLPGTQEALLIQSDREIFSFKQLAPLMKMDLAVLAPATRFMVLLYGTPMLYAPKKMVRFINIGRDLT